MRDIAGYYPRGLGVAAWSWCFLRSVIAAAVSRRACCAMCQNGQVIPHPLFLREVG